MLNVTRIYFQDEHCAVIYKTAGEDSQSFYTGFFPQAPFAAPVNRLDAPVSGLLVIAFSARIQTVLSRAFAEHRVIKEYRAICERRTVEPAYLTEPGLLHRLEHRIGFNAKKRKAFIGSTPASGKNAKTAKEKAAALKDAVLYWRLCGKGERYDFLQIFPETGRTHQIRAQMAHTGRPVKGDLKYGARRSEKNGGIRLHCFGLRFTHPVTGASLSIQAVPQQTDPLWTACMEACAGYAGQLPENTVGVPVKMSAYRTVSTQKAVEEADCEKI